MKKWYGLSGAALFLAMLSLSGVLCVKSDPVESKKEAAVSLVREARGYFEKEGRGKTLEELNKKDGKFNRGGSYVFAYSIEGVLLAHPHKKNLVGKDLSGWIDTDGNFFRKEIVAKARRDGSGWVKYVYDNPETGKSENKMTYFERAGDLILSCGIYIDGKK